MVAERRRLVAGNWKMNGLRADGLALARALVEKIRAAAPKCDVAVCPPATLLVEIGRAVADAGGAIALGAQDCAPQSAGAHTGDVSAPMLADAGCRYVILGHSERRAGHQETNALVRAKAEAAIAAGLVPILCVGESEAEREAGRTRRVVAAQLARSLPVRAGAHEVVIAYEPVWAIGSGRTPTGEQIREVHAAIRAQLRRRIGAPGERVCILYGGSVKPANAPALMAIGEVDGGLVGGASLNAEDFWAICEACGSRAG